MAFSLLCPRLIRLISQLGIVILFCQTGATQDQTIRLTVPGGTLEGSLRVAQPFDSTLIILVAGSGPTDRNGNQPQGGAATLQMLADSLEVHGVSTFRYDKRNIGQSTFDSIREEDLRFDSLVVDVGQWIRHFSSDGRFTNILLAGHSEGALVTTLAANRYPEVDGLITLAGAGRTADSLIMIQLERQPPFVQVATDSLFRQIREGQEAKSPPYLMALFRPSVQPYLRSWIVINPAEEIVKLGIPVLVVQGGKDLQVFQEDADRLFRSSRHSTILKIEDMNHTLKAVGDQADNMASYTDPGRPLHPALIPGMIAWLESFRRK
ncbi:MAG: lysophospholipase [Saprospiraceae bacterium]|nr:lysophospholipase [Saprospiraceae bacterium]